MINTGIIISSNGMQISETAIICFTILFFFITVSLITAQYFDHKFMLDELIEKNKTLEKKENNSGLFVTKTETIFNEKGEE